jgi:hypothetical protein
MMSARYFKVRPVLLFLLLATGLSGCTVSTAKATSNFSVSAEVFDAQQLIVAGPLPVTIVSDLPGEIQVVSYPVPEVAIDVITTGQGASEDEATLQARRGVSITMQYKDGGVLVQVLRAENSANRAVLHVRVPDESSIFVESPQANAHVAISGSIKDAKIRIQQGDVVVRGAAGNLDVKTGRGAITVDERSGEVRALDLQANAGNITVFALNAKVTARTTDGSIRFVGTLRATSGSLDQGDTRSEFAVNGAGDITVALPDNAKFRYRAFGGARVISDVARDVEACGFISSTVYDFLRRRSSGAAEVGRVEFGGTYTNTSQVQGTLGNGIAYFETNRNLLTIFDPANPPARSGGPAASGFVGDCGRFTTANLAVANIDFTVRADLGTIWIHQINMR